MTHRARPRTQRRGSGRAPTGPHGVRAVALACAVLIAGCAAPSDPGPTPDPTLELAPEASGFVNPVAVTNAGDGSERLFVVERDGLVFVVEGGSVQETPYLDLSGALGDRAGENGLLGLAFHPSFASNGRLFAHFVDDARGNVLAELVADPPSADTVDTGTLEVLLRVTTTSDFHVGGHVAFGPDGYLYAGLGDGGVAAAAQNLADPYGGLLRLDVDGAVVPSVPDDNPFVGTSGARPETWVYGLRNPWRFSFDAETGDLWIADVGEDAVEEINVLPAGAAGGANYGWPIMEGDRCYSPATDCDRSGLTLPDFVYTHPSDGGRSVTGGYVYRGAAIPQLVGSYVFGDFISGELLVVRSGTDGSEPEPLLETSYRVVGFGVDEADEILVVDYAGGGIYRLVPSGP